MKQFILYMVAMGVLAITYTSCDTDIEEQNLQPNYEYTDAYYENLRAYKSTMFDRSMCFVWFADYQQSTSLAYRFAGLPDSIDICSLWGGIPQESVNPLAYKEMWDMRNIKGTLLVVPTIIRIANYYEELGLEWSDVTSDAKTIEPDGEFPDWVILFGNKLLNEMWDNNLDGLDLDYEPEGDYLQNAKMSLFVKYLGQFIGPMSPNPDKLLIIDHYGQVPPTDTEPYIDLLVKQHYGSSLSSSSFRSGFPQEKQVFTENIGDYWATGGNMLQQAAWQPETGYKGGFGAFYVQRDYNTTTSGANKDEPYGNLRKAIQLQNPAVVK